MRADGAAATGGGGGPAIELDDKPEPQANQWTSITGS